jgi:hypothetical protein
MNKILLAAMIISACAMQAFAQREFTVETEGTVIAVLSKTTPTVAEMALRKNIFEYGYIPKNKKGFTHGYVDTKNQMIFCYDLEFGKGANPKQFFVSIKPAENCYSEDKYKDFKKISLPKYLDNVAVNDGDTIVLDILKNSQTGAMIQDLIKVTSERKPLGGYFSELDEAKDFSIDDVQFQIVDYDVYINDKLVENKYPNAPNRRPLAVVGSAIGFTFNKRGSFMFSPFPNQKLNLEKLGVIEDNKLFFNRNGDTYKIVSKVSILGNGRKWNVWGRFEPFDAAEEQMPDWMVYRTAAGNSIAGFLNNKPTEVKPTMIFNQ